jgi:hypothetical protein
MLADKLASTLTEDKRPEPHRFAFPIVREITAPAPRHSQRELVVASLLRCDRKDPSSRRHQG